MARRKKRVRYVRNKKGIAMELLVAIMFSPFFAALLYLMYLEGN